MQNEIILQREEDLPFYNIYEIMEWHSELNKSGTKRIYSHPNSDVIYSVILSNWERDLIAEWKGDFDEPDYE